VLLVAAVVALLLAVSVARQYRWVTELSDLQQQQTDRALALSTEGFVRQANRELEDLWYILHVRAGWDPEQELGEDLARWAESADYPGLIERAYWIEDPGTDRQAETIADASGLTVRPISLADGAFAGPVPVAGFEPLLERLSVMPMRFRRRAFSPRDGFLVAVDGGRQVFVAPQPAMRTRTWAVAVLAPEVADAWFATLVAEHFGPVDDREFNVRVFRNGEHDAADAIYVSDAAGAAESWDAPDAVSRAQYLTVAVQHREGSIAIAAGNVRATNLAFTFGTVLVLLAGLGALAVATRRAQRLVQRQTEFVAGVSHELRTPISGISVLSQNLADGVVEDAGQAAIYGRSIHRESRRLRDMVEGVLQLSAIRSGGFQYEFAPLDIADVIDDSLDALDPADRAAVTVTIADDPPAIRGDRRALVSAVRNLVSNALKFGGTPPDVLVTVRSAVRRGRPEAEVEVADSGCGIEVSDQKHLFEPFFRGRAAHAAQAPGSGLGLSVVKSVVAAHGGRVTLTSAPGRGSRFTLHLPALVRAVPQVLAEDEA
jgi:signal transduction histidine kinase